MRHSRHFLAAAALAALALSAPPARAQDDSGLVRLREGQTIVNLSASERRDVTQDILTASLRYETQGKDPKALQNEINTVMKKVLDRARATEGVKVSTDSYYVYPFDPAPPAPVPYPHEEKGGIDITGRNWRGSQSLRLESRSADTLLELTGALQDMGLLLGGLSYSLSPEKAEEVKDSLMEAALAKLEARAQRAGKALGMAKAELVEISIDTANNESPMPMARMAMIADAAPMSKGSTPAAEPGETEIVLNVSARALLKP